MSGSGGGGSRRGRSGSGQGTGFALTAAVAAVSAVVGAAAVEHAQAQAEGRPSLVESAWRWLTTDFLGEGDNAHAAQGSGGSGAGPSTYRQYRRTGGRLSAADVACLPTREYGTGAGSSDDQRKTFCAVCQETFTQGDKLIRLPCFHEFHTDCITDYLCSAERALCPICRHPVAQIELNT